MILVLEADACVHVYPTIDAVILQVEGLDAEDTLRAVFDETGQRFAIRWLRPNVEGRSLGVQSGVYALEPTGPPDLAALRAALAGAPILPAERDPSVRALLAPPGARRIAIIGGSGAGKTTLGRALARRLGAPFVEVDALRHRAGWVTASAEEVRAAVHGALEGQAAWVIDGTCQREVGRFVSERADVIVWLDLPLAVKLARLWRRSWRRVRRREVLWNGNVETWRDVVLGRDSVLGHALLSHRRHRRAFPLLPDADKIVRLRTAAQVERWLADHPRPA
jgi:adenylate kinase family enzyme